LPTESNRDLDSFLSTRRTLIEQTLEAQLPQPTEQPPVIHEAMRYSVLAGGKRIRPLLAIAAAEATGGSSEPFLGHFCALELIHTYSLIHDDLPALDNDDLRRGRKTSHVVFGEAMAILAGDALLTEAFYWLARPAPGVDPARQLAAIAEVSEAIGSEGMIGGQVADIQAEKRPDNAQSRPAMETLEFIHRNKTGRLLTASVVLGGLLGGATEGQLTVLRTYGEAIGLAFQIVDDLLDIEQTAETLGKTAGKDLEQGKLTYPLLLGVAESRRRLTPLVETAAASARLLGSRSNFLEGIARYLCDRVS